MRKGEDLLCLCGGVGDRLGHGGIVVLGMVALRGKALLGRHILGLIRFLRKSCRPWSRFFHMFHRKERFYDVLNTVVAR